MDRFWGYTLSGWPQKGILVDLPYLPYACCLLLNKFGPDLFGGYRFGFEMLLINGAICFAGLLIASSGKYGREGSVAGK